MSLKRARSADVFGDDKAFVEPSKPGGAAFEAPPVAEMDESRVVRPVKAYKNQGFLTSHGARTIRIMAEHQETLDRLEQNGVKDFVLFFSSARGRSSKQIAEQRQKYEAVAADSSKSQADKEAATKKLAQLDTIEWMAPFYAGVTELAARITRWAMQRDPDPNDKHFVVATGGGPGLMEAANKGAASVDPSRSVGMGISLPFEPGLNPFVTPELAFEFHYFFMRKFMMVSHTRALIACPGGFGTCDELFEIMTLVQTGKHPRIPIVLFGKSYWSQVVNWEKMAEFGVINIGDLEDVLTTDDVDEAYKHIVEHPLLLGSAGKAAEK